MLNAKLVFALAALVVSSFAHRGGGRGPRGGGFLSNQLTATLECGTDESFSCASRRVEDGLLACRTKSDGSTKTVCADPAAAADTDTCGCCPDVLECPTECPCECGGGLGYWIEPTQGHGGHRHHHHDGDDDEDTEEGALAVLVCAPQLHAITAVAAGKATCLTTCSIDGL